jgi:hypothetical protein
MERAFSSRAWTEGAVTNIEEQVRWQKRLLKMVNPFPTSLIERVADGGLTRFPKLLAGPAIRSPSPTSD